MSSRLYPSCNFTKEELDNAPEGIRYQNAMQLDGYYYAMAISVYDCTGCGSCANVCPVNNAGKKAPALVMTSFDDETANEQEKYDYLVQLAEKQEVLDKFKISTVKGSQFRKPYLEFSGACAGCGETPYAKLVTQLFGDRMYIANATGCSSIWVVLHHLHHTQ